MADFPEPWSGMAGDTGPKAGPPRELSILSGQALRGLNSPISALFTEKVLLLAPRASGALGYVNHVTCGDWYLKYSFLFGG